MSGKCGGLTGAREATAEVQEIIEKIRADLEGKTNKSYSPFTAKVFATQTVAGTNYFVKIDVGDEHVHVRIFRNLQGEYSLHSYQEGKGLEDALEYF